MHKLVMVGRDQALLRIRKLMFQKHGLEVALAFAPLDLMKISGPAHLLILCHTLSPEDCQVASAIATTRWPQIKQLVLATWVRECTIPGQTERFTTLEGPESLLARIDQLLPQAERPQHV